MVNCLQGGHLSAFSDPIIAASCLRLKNLFKHASCWYIILPHN